MARLPSSVWWYRMRRALARSADSRFAFASALVLAPHPDDETIACGLMIAARVARGQHVTVAVASDGRLGWFSAESAPDGAEIAAIRSAEWSSALRALGVTSESQRQFGLPDQGLTHAEADLEHRVGALIDEVLPDQVFVTAPDDLHPDHRALARATCRALASRATAPPSADTSGAGAARQPELYAYRVYPAAGIWRQDELGDEVAPRPTARAVARALPRLLTHRELVFRAPDLVAAKHAAMAAHASQRGLLDGELRFVWERDAELFSRLDPGSVSSSQRRLPD